MSQHVVKLSFVQGRKRVLLKEVFLKRRMRAIFLMTYLPWGQAATAWTLCPTRLWDCGESQVCSLLHPVSRKGPAHSRYSVKSLLNG